MRYQQSDITVSKKHIYTKDMKYYLATDGHYDYWHEIKRIAGSKITIGFPMGHHSYDYCFRSSVTNILKRLNSLINRKP